MRTRTAKRRNRTGRETSGATRTLRVILAADEADAIALKQRLEGAVATGRHLAIDAGAVATLTTAGVQVLLAAAASAAARHVQFRLTASGSAMIDAFGELGLADTIASWLEPAESSRAGDAAEA